MNELMLSDGVSYIVDGSIIIISRFPKIKWVAHYGTFQYKQKKYTGWYASSIPSQTILPLTEAELMGVSLSEDNCDCDHHCHPPYPPYPYPPHPHPPHPHPPYTPDPEYIKMIEQAFISVEYLADRDALHDVMDVPDGKLVRVDDCGEHDTKYFRWNRAKGEWVEEKFGSIDAYTTAEADAKFATKDSVSSEVEQQISILNIDEKIRDAVDAADIPGLVNEGIEDANIDQKISDAISSSTTVQTIVRETATEVTQKVVDASIEELRENISTNTKSIETLESQSSWVPLPEVNT